MKTLPICATGLILVVSGIVGGALAEIVLRAPSVRAAIGNLTGIAEGELLRQNALIKERNNELAQQRAAMKPASPAQVNVIQAREFQVVNASGEIVAVLGHFSNGNGVFGLRQTGTSRFNVFLSVLSAGSGALSLEGAEGMAGVSAYGQLSPDAAGGFVGIGGRNDKTVLSIASGTSGGTLFANQDDGESIAGLTRGGFILRNAGGESIASLQENLGGDGMLVINDRNARLRALLSVSSDGGGVLNILDSSGEVKFNSSTPLTVRDTIRITKTDTLAVRGTVRIAKTDTVTLSVRDTIQITKTDTLVITVQDTVEVSTAPRLPGDLNDDDAVDFRDFLLFAQQYGKRLGS